MKRFAIYMIGICLSLAACDTEHSDNGSLDGFWQLSQVDTLLTGHSTDMRQSQVTWAVQGSILETRIADGSPTEDIIFRFTHTADSLKLTAPYISDRAHGDILVEDVEVLRPYGISKLEEGFKILQLSESRMELRSETLQLHFRKY